MTGLTRLPALLAVLLGAAAVAAAQAKKDYKSEPLAEAAPAEVAAKVREVIEEKGIRVLDPKGKPLADIWLRKTVPTTKPKEELGVKFGALEEGTLLGVLRFHEKPGDFKGNDFPPGVYTMRYGLQPKDGDHLGVSENRDFVLLSPVKADTKLEAVPHKQLVELSTQVSGIKHPTVLYLVKTQGDAKPPRVYQDESTEHIVFDAEIPSEPKGSPAIRFGVVLQGEAAE